MKRFILFAGDDYYPLGGVAEIQGDFDTMDEGLDFLWPKRNKHGLLDFDWFHFLDQATGKMAEIGDLSILRPDDKFWGLKYRTGRQ